MNEASLLLLANPSWGKIQSYSRHGDCFVLKLDHKTIAIVVIVPKQKGIMEITNIAIHPLMQRNGFGHIVLNAALDHARVKGARSEIVSTGNSSFGPLALYNACGFIISSVNKGYFLRDYDKSIYENNVQCIDHINLSLSL